jgi:hypothetical protein
MFDISTRFRHARVAPDMTSSDRQWLAKDTGLTCADLRSTHRTKASDTEESPCFFTVTTAALSQSHALTTLSSRTSVDRHGSAAHRMQRTLQPSNIQATPLSFLPEGFKRAAAAGLRVDESQAPPRACTGKAMTFFAARESHAAFPESVHRCWSPPLISGLILNPSRNRENTP